MVCPVREIGDTSAAGTPEPLPHLGLPTPAWRDGWSYYSCAILSRPPAKLGWELNVGGEG